MLTKPWRSVVRTALTGIGLAAVLVVTLALAETAVTQTQAPPGTATSAARPGAPTLHRTIRVDGLDIFYREAGPKDAPAILLLHGFPTSSQMFRNLIPALADEYHVVAPDYPGYGHSSMPPRDKFAYTFDNLAKVIDEFTEKVGLTQVRPLRAGLRRPGRLPAGGQAPGAGHGHRGAERQRLRRGARQRLLEADQGVLEGAEEQGEARRPAQPAHLRGDQVAVHARGAEPRAASARTARPTTSSCSTARATTRSSSTCSSATAATRRCTRSGRRTSASTSRRC